MSGPVDVLVNSFLLVFAGEMGDKTQLLALVLVARFRKPWTILAGVFIATLLNHALASLAGDWLSSRMPPDLLRWMLAGLFFAFAVWLLFPDKEEKLEETGHWGALGTTIVAFFMAEMGDKTQLATVALGARYGDFVLVTIGTTLGMMASNALAIFCGPAILARLPMKWFHRTAALLFLIFGILILVKPF